MNTPLKIEIIPVGADNMDSQIYFDVYLEGRKKYSKMSAAGVMEVIGDVHDWHEANRKEYYKTLKGE